MKFPDLKTLGPETDFRTVIDAFISLEENGDIILGVDLGNEQNYVIMGFGEDVYRIEPMLALRLADYIDYTVSREQFDGKDGLIKVRDALRAIANGLGVTTILNH